MPDINCPFRSLWGGQPVCQIVADITDVPLSLCQVNDSACSWCLQCPTAPQAPNKATASMAIHACHRAEIPVPAAIRAVTTVHIPAHAGKPTLESLPCSHRGRELRQQYCKPCQAGGGPPTVPVYSCPMHQECTLRNTGTHPKIQACLTCPDRQVPVQLVRSR